MRRAVAVRWLLIALVPLAACESPAPESTSIYESAPVEKREIAVTVDAAGVIEPETTVDVKSKASGEILAVHADTGDHVDAGALLVEVDKRVPRNRLAEAEASLTAAQARQKIAETQMKRAETLFKSATLTQADYEQSQLEFANAKAQVVSAQVALENARIAMDDTDVRAPSAGTIIQKYVEPGTVISSPTQDVGGGTLLMKMADLGSVIVRTLVDETDIGKVSVGLDARVTVAAYPNQPFTGKVLKIEPQAIVEQNVTMFAVLIRLDNKSGLLKPGMNAEVSISVAERNDVPAVPTAALRTDTDIASTAEMLGVDEATLRAELAASAGAGAPGAGSATAAAGEARGGAAWGGGGPGSGQESSPGAPDPALRALLEKRRNGETLTPEERAQMRAAFQAQGGRRPGGQNGSRSSRSKGGNDYEFGGSYWVIKLENGKPKAVNVRTGLTDMAYSEVTAGLSPGDRVLLLPSTSLYEQQARLQSFIDRRFSRSTPFQASR